MYPGDRFGIPGPIPSIRLKLQRNAVQDINLIDARARAAGRLVEVRRQAAERIPVRLWEVPPEVLTTRPPEEWDSRNLQGSQDDAMARHEALDPLWWADVREIALQGVRP